MANFGLLRFGLKGNSQFSLLKPLAGTLQFSHCSLCTTQTNVSKLKRQYRYRHFSDNRFKTWSKSRTAEQENLMDPHQEEDQKNRDESWRKMKYSLLAVSATIGIGGGIMAYSLGRPEVDDDGNIKQDAFSHMPIITQFFRRMIHNIEYYNKMIKEPSRDKLLPDPLAPPYIQPPYTLVLEITDLLVHPEWTYQTGWRFKKRPGVDKFLEQVGPPHFEVVVYTAEQGMTVYPILDTLDPKNNIMFRLVRDATDFIDGHHVKNLDCLNRDLKKVIVVDWNPNSVKLHRNNTFLVPRWKGNDDDTTLIDLATFLKTISVNEIDDVRNVLTYYSQFDNPIEAFRVNQRRLLDLMEEKEKYNQEKKQNPSLTSRWAGNFPFKR